MDLQAKVVFSAWETNRALELIPTKALDSFEACYITNWVNTSGDLVNIIDFSGLT